VPSIAANVQTDVDHSGSDQESAFTGLSRSPRISSVFDGGHSGTFLSRFWFNSGFRVSIIVSPHRPQFSLGRADSMSLGPYFTVADHQFVLFHGRLGTPDGHPPVIGPDRICLAIASPPLQSLPVSTTHLSQVQVDPVTGLRPPTVLPGPLLGRAETVGFQRMMILKLRCLSGFSSACSESMAAQYALKRLSSH